MNNVQVRGNPRTAVFDRLTERLPIRVDEYRDGGVQVIRADIPGVDINKDLNITVRDGIVHIFAERPMPEAYPDDADMRFELCYGSYSRRLPMPDTASEADITTTYEDGILEIHVPITKSAAAQPTPG